MWYCVHLFSMEKITIKGRFADSAIFTGERINNLPHYIPSKGVYIITDGNVNAIYRGRFPECPTFVVEPGEASKSIQTVVKIYRWLLDSGADRSSFIVAIGGGVICDIAGFVASTFMRGVKFGFVATSLLAQVDASVGGKNGIDLDGYKNIVGTFNQPQFVICDVSMLITLPRIELANGFAEIVKHAIIADAGQFAFIEANVDRLNACDIEVITPLVEKSIRIKTNIVTADEHESGERRKLNLGHTWGHAVEKVSGLPHGQSVSIGLEFAARLSCSKGVLGNREYFRLINLLRGLKLQVCSTMSQRKIFEALLKDKKKEKDFIHFVLMEGIGSVRVEAISIQELKAFIKIEK